MPSVKEYIEEKRKGMLDELSKHAKDSIAQRETVSNEEKDLTREFYKAFASKDRGALNEVNAKIEKSYLDKLDKNDPDYAKKAQNIGTSADGGVLVPTTLAESIVTKMQYISPMRQIATVISDMPAILNIPSETALPTWSWESEGATIPQTGGTYAPNLLTPFKHAGLDTFTSEVIADAATNPAIQNFIEDRFAVSGAIHENQAFVNGSGSGQPYGFRSTAITPASIAIAGTTTAYDDIRALWNELPTAYTNIGVFVLPKAAIDALMGIKDTMGRPIWRDGLEGPNPQTLLGRPAFLVDEIPSNLGTGTDATEIWFGYFKNYIIGDRGAIRMDYGTNGNDFANDSISLRAAKRVAGMPLMSEAFAVLTGVK